MNESRTKSFQYFLGHIRRLVQLHWMFTAMSFAFTLVIQGIRRDAIPLFILTGIMAVSTAIFSSIYRRIERSATSAELRYGHLARISFVQILLDFMIATVGVHLTGGSISPVPLTFIIYFGTLATFFPTDGLRVLTFAAVGMYGGLMQSYRLGMWEPIVPAVMSNINVNDEFSLQVGFFYTAAMILTGLLVSDYSQRTHHAWADADNESDYLSQLHELTLLGLGNPSGMTLYQLLANKIKSITQADSVFITRWDEENGQVFAAAASDDIHDYFMRIPPAPPNTRTLTNSIQYIGKPIVVEDINRSPYISARTAMQLPVKSLVAVPLYGVPDRRYLGALMIASKDHRTFTSQETQRGQQLADIAAVLISRTRLYEETLRRAELLEKLAGQITSLTSDLKRTTLLPSIVESARELLHAERAALFLKTPPTTELSCVYSVGLSTRFVEQFPHRFGQLPGAQVLTDQKFVLVPDVHQDSRTSPAQDLIGRENFRAYAVFALTSINGPLGALTLCWDLPHAIASDEVAVGILFAERAAAVLHNANLVERIAEESVTDSLTSLPNRRSLDQRLVMEAERSSRYGKPFTLLMIDLDGFKGINDNFGHPIGDSVLQQVSSALGKIVRSSDFLARYGGDEFAIILPEADNERGILVAEKLRLALTTTKLHLPNETQRYLSACVGIACFPEDSDVVVELLSIADKRLYFAKRSGKGIISKDSELQSN